MLFFFFCLDAATKTSNRVLKPKLLSIKPKIVLLPLPNTQYG